MGMVASERAWVTVNVNKARAIALAYDLMPSGPPATVEALQSYLALRNEVYSQYCELAFRGIQVEATADPAGYATSAEMFADIECNNRLIVFTGGEKHPFFRPIDNFRFRAVHDYFGHYLNRYSFGPNGEDNAWRFHCSMFSTIAKPAMTAETRGQNSWVNFGPHSYLPVSQRPFAEQKANLLPEWCMS